MIAQITDESKQREYLMSVFRDFRVMNPINTVVAAFDSDGNQSLRVTPGPNREPAITQTYFKMFFCSGDPPPIDVGLKRVTVGAACVKPLSVSIIFWYGSNGPLPGPPHPKTHYKKV